MGWADAEKIICVQIWSVQLDLNHLKTSTGNGFFKEFWVVLGFLWGPLGTQTGEPPLGVENGVSWYRKIGLCADLEDVHCTTGSQSPKNRLWKQMFWRYFGCFFGSGGVFWSHGLVPHPQGLRMGWADTKKLVCVRILRIYDWFLTTTLEKSHRTGAMGHISAFSYANFIS